MQRHARLLAVLAFILVAATTVGVRPAAADSDLCPTEFIGAGTPTNCHSHLPTPREVAPAGEEIERAKTAAANVYARYRGGEATFADVLRADGVVSRLTGELTTERSMIALTLAPGGAGALLRGYMPFRQINSYYCGPATVQSMLWQLKTSDRRVRDGDGGLLALTGEPTIDQPRLAGDEWLGTERFGGTPWGDEYLPRTLNRWLGSDWYVSSGTPNVDGNLTKAQAWRNIQYAVDRGYPVAANVVYSPQTYYPAGFYPGVTYSHWDTISGYGNAGGRQTVNVGQVYGSDGMTYEPLQEVSWDTHWNAIGSWYGIVW